ncbi:uncharacterized protein LOC122624101 [Drosophila teissieri]|uniref:uncharacterized protein LOC122624101 n=1 Tax=Drosophila teissieri TaxID=7243 RepID=UPI001CBA4168|nr:uncharacterized protein LOC122624101 [Drosophila teissieri]
MVAYPALAVSRFDVSGAVGSVQKAEGKAPADMSSSNRIRPELLLLQLLLLIPLLQAGTVAAPHLDSDSDLDSVSDPDTTTYNYDPHQESETETESETEATAAQVDGQRIDCKLTFDAATMDSLGCHNEGALQARGAWLPLASGNKPMEQLAEANPDAWRPRHLKSPDSQPIYELQLVVWPSDIEDGDDFSPPLATTTSTTTTARTTRATSTSSTTPSKPNPSQIGTPIEQMWPLYEDQLVVFPQMDFEEENLDYFFDEVPPPTPAPTPPTTTSTSTHPTGTPTPTPIYVVQNYHVIHPNGTEEYKLVMSNGLVNYKKLYTKRVADRLVNVQEGYNSVPIPGPRNQIQTQYYIADERGYNVYRIELHYQQPGLPKHLHYKATKATNM